jgi:hydroxymethylbilane synthase
MPDSILRLATRGSPLALAQARLVRAALANAHDWHPDEIEELCPILIVRTSGDKIQDRPLVEAGGKGLFVKEIEEALLKGDADIAVHSMKDMPAAEPKGLTIAAVLPREDPYDVFVAKNGTAFEDLKRGARLGTSSVRRAAQALRLRPDLKIVSLRGNVETRLLKLSRDEADAIILARAGISRLNLSLPDSEVLDWLPALCQGAVGVEIRSKDARVRTLLEPIDDPKTHLAIAFERGFLAALDGSCRTPIAGLASLRPGNLHFTGEVLTLDGKESWSVARELALSGNPADDRKAAFAAGEDAAREIRKRAGAKLPRF